MHALKRMRTPLASIRSVDTPYPPRIPALLPASHRDMLRRNKGDGMSDERSEHAPWPMRAALLLALGAICGLAVDLLIRDRGTDYWSFTDSIPRQSLAIWVCVGGILFAFTLERARWAWSLAFALAGGAVLGGIYYWNGSPEHHSADDAWRALASLLAVAVAAPLFQTMRDEGARRLPYVAVHAHAWTNVVLWFAAWAFVLISWLLAQLLAELFQLIGIRLLRETLNKPWANWMLVGGALGAAVGLLRDRDRVLGLLQRVATTVLSVLAPVLAVGLVLFVLALPFTGLAPLWDQTRATTPILLSCVIGAVILANAVIGNSPEEEAGQPVLRWSAVALGAVIAPLVLVAAISTGLRIGQHGYTPSRLWAIVFIAIAAAYALAYLYALVRGRLWRWADHVRPANIKLAIGVCVVALLLATPIAQFGAISTRSQLARLDAGALDATTFDWQAMRFDFGASGVRALEWLRAQGKDAEVRRRAGEALVAQTRWQISGPFTPRGEQALPEIIVRPIAVEIPSALRDVVLGQGNPPVFPTPCISGGRCQLFWTPGATTAIAAMTCPDEATADVTPDRISLRCENRVTPLELVDERWINPTEASPRTLRDAERASEDSDRRQAIDRGEVEIREVTRRQVFVGDRPVGQVFE
jgi:hypothetical protein